MGGGGVAPKKRCQISFARRFASSLLNKKKISACFCFRFLDTIADESKNKRARRPSQRHLSPPAPPPRSRGRSAGATTTKSAADGRLLPRPNCDGVGGYDDESGYDYNSTATSFISAVPRRGRGRPPKARGAQGRLVGSHGDDDSVGDHCSIATSFTATSAVIRRGPGRPRKAPGAPSETFAGAQTSRGNPRQGAGAAAGAVAAAAMRVATTSARTGGKNSEWGRLLRKDISAFQESDFAQHYGKMRRFQGVCESRRLGLKLPCL